MIILLVALVFPVSAHTFEAQLDRIGESMRPAFLALPSGARASFVDDDEGIDMKEVEERKKKMRAKLAEKNGVKLEDVSEGEMFFKITKTGFGPVPVPHFRFEYPRKTHMGVLKVRVIAHIYEEDPKNYLVEDVRGIRVAPIR